MSPAAVESPKPLGMLVLKLGEAPPRIPLAAGFTSALRRLKTKGPNH